MKVREFINVYVFARLANNNKNTFDTMSESYDKEFFYIPRLYAKDGFNISVQVHHGNYCASENGTREFGLDWHEVEWGFPSQEIDAVKYNAEDESNTMGTVGGYVSVELIEELMNEHGGFDLAMTLAHGVGLE